MKTKFYFVIVILMIISNIKAQEYSNTPNGFRVKKGEKNYFRIYKNNEFKIDTTDYRRLDPSVYFEISKNNKEIKFNKKTYVLISIPGVRNKSQIKKECIAGSRVSSVDFDKEFWTEKENIFVVDKDGRELYNENNIEKNYSKFSNDFFSGLLTAPFKYRFGGSNKSLIDGDFNIAPFLGWKFRLSQNKPYLVAPFIFAGVTTLKYNSTNNTKITDLSIEENGSGFTYGGGFSLRLGNISPGIIIGVDQGVGNLGSGFVYNNKAWLSFSLNYDFFKLKVDAKDDGN